MKPISDMASSETLIQRFIDQELSAEERLQFVARLGRDEALRQRAIELEQLVLDAGRLPRPAVPDTFAAGVMGRLDILDRARPARPSVLRRLRDTLWAPRAFEWNLAGAMAAGSLAVLAVAAVMMRSGSKAGAPAGLRPGTASAEAASAVTLVRLVVMEPGAKTVQVAGDFNAWNPARTSLEQTSSGAWTVTIPLKPGRYAYMFVVDGQRWVADPFAAEQNDDGFGSRNAVLEVRTL